MDRLIAEIEASAEWRVRELELMKKICVVTLSNEPQHTKDQFYRMCIPYVYAHWEGFVIEVFNFLSDYINTLKLDKSNTIVELYAFSIQNELRPLSGKQGFEQSCKFTEKFVNQHNRPLYIDPKLVTAKSNLNYSQVDDIFKKFGIECPVSEQSADINQLVNLRNQIAHGESGITVDYDNISQKINTLQIMFDKITLSIYKYLSDQGYLKHA